MTWQPNDHISLVVGLPKGTLQVKQLLSASSRRNSLCVDRMFIDKAGLVNSSLYFVLRNNLIRLKSEGHFMSLRRLTLDSTRIHKLEMGQETYFVRVEIIERTHYICDHLFCHENGRANGLMLYSIFLVDL
jgi:hypothetical protein